MSHSGDLKSVTKSLIMSKDVSKRRPFFMQFLQVLLLKYSGIRYNGSILL